ncbi:alanyl-tRNA synthetase (plasmid) [Legionella adelaidensis]|uniref:Alanyl-tRNA synthetase n=1 Tax=Legionella adelaidensis TaxID=45056 RepID=A0A0W0R3N9_9GAMM|nr:alanyl-tRNA editing protein [Legionella adelaidensis]KTC65697.1 alanyl-tRNA synthetase [Legionella adelaidensis]VEH85979.1 alanyl-tRNA synthetase [Legionella adelaidensis]
MTKKVFWDNPYLTELNTVVDTLENDEITLRETIFYAFSGGQESDCGTIEDYPVLEARKEGKQIYYKLPSDHKLKAGDHVLVLIDWRRRYQLMRLHFAAELVLELVCRRFSDVVKVGAHIAEDKARIDFQWYEKISPFINSLQEEAQHIIDIDEEIISAFSDEKNERRYWKINEFAQVPCGGTHVKRTGEIGQIRLKRQNPGKGKERIEIFIL